MCLSPNSGKHFREWFSENFKISDIPLSYESYDAILSEIKKKSPNISTFTKLDVRMAIKEIRAIKKDNLYVNHSHIKYIVNKFNNVAPVTIDLDTENSIYEMFDQTVNVFLKNGGCCISYDYLLFKICQLLKLDHFIKFHMIGKFPVSKLTYQDTKWKIVCDELNWQFIPSIDKQND